ncbi:hypothetical protein ABKN59_011437 [Abortiporus biennis]
MHAIWKLMLGDSFEEVYRYGIIINCSDGITRRLYPRFFIYSADYPEKVLLATIRDMGAYPCPWCLVPKSSIHEIGYIRDANWHVDAAHIDDAWRRDKVETARKFIYDQEQGVTSKAVEDQLQEQSLVPTENAFSSQLSEFLPNFHQLFVPDLMHEWELGVWKQILTHLVCILYAEKGGKVAEFDHHFQMVPSFGTDTIRAFGSMKVSEMKKMAVRNFEDILQCIIPIFDGLLPEPHNKIVIDLLFSTVTLHTLHKLWMHTDATLSITWSVTKDFGDILRKFKAVTCAAYETHELPKEATARQRRVAREVVAQIQASDSNSPETHVSTQSTPLQPSKPFKKEFNLQTYKIHSLGDYADIINPALKNFLPKLKIYLLLQLDSFKNQLVSSQPHTTLDPNALSIKDDRIFPHPLLYINYTTYDIHSETDIIHVGSDRCDVMVLADNDDPSAHPFCPADVIRLVHLISVFFQGYTDTLLGPSMIARGYMDPKDWENYYVDQFANRDMTMRYIGGGIGHQLPLLNIHMLPESFSVHSDQPETQDSTTSGFFNDTLDIDMEDSERMRTTSEDEDCDDNDDSSDLDDDMGIFAEL